MSRSSSKSTLSLQVSLSLLKLMSSLGLVLGQPLLKDSMVHQYYDWGLHIMDSHGLCNWYSQPTLRVLHNSYSSRRWPTLGFFLIWYVGQRLACLVICSAKNGPSGCLWYDEWPIKLPFENIISLESCDMQLFKHRSYISVTSVYQSKRPVHWSPVHQMDHPVTDAVFYCL